MSFPYNSWLTSFNSIHCITILPIVLSSLFNNTYLYLSKLVALKYFWNAVDVIVQPSRLAGVNQAMAANLASLMIMSHVATPAALQDDNFSGRQTTTHICITRVHKNSNALIMRVWAVRSFNNFHSFSHSCYSGNFMPSHPVNRSYVVKWP